MTSKLLEVIVFSEMLLGNTVAVNILCQLLELFNILVKRKRSSMKVKYSLPANTYLFKVNNRNNRKWCEICSNLAIMIKKTEQNDITDLTSLLCFYFNSEHISYLVLVFLLSTLNK